MNEIIERIKEKIKDCKTSTQEDRARKGAYVDCIVIIKESGNLGEARNAVLVDGCVAMDERRYLSIVSDMAQYWSAEDPKEKIAMKWMAIKIYAAFNVSEKKATVS